MHEKKQENLPLAEREWGQSLLKEVDSSLVDAIRQDIVDFLLEICTKVSMQRKRALLNYSVSRMDYNSLLELQSTLHALRKMAVVD